MIQSFSDIRSRKLQQLFPDMVTNGFKIAETGLQRHTFVQQQRFYFQHSVHSI